MPRHARQASRDEILPPFLYGGSKVTLQFVRVEGESLEIEATCVPCTGIPWYMVEVENITVAFR